MAFVAATLIILGCIASGTYLVVTEHYWWAWLPFLIGGSISVSNRSGDCDCEKDKIDA